MHLVGFVTRSFQDARSPERQTENNTWTVYTIYTQKTLSKTHYTLENSRTIGHRSNQHLQKHAY